MQRTLTDWQGKLRVADVVGDSVGILVRRPALGVLAPTAIFAVSGWLVQDVVAGPFDWIDPGLEWRGLWMLAAQCVLALPALGLLWASLSHRVLAPTSRSPVPRARRLAMATLLAIAIGLVTLFAAITTGFAAVLLVPLVGTAVPVCACERLGPAASLSRAILLTGGNRLRLLAAWALLVLIVLVCAVAIGMAMFIVAGATNGALPFGMAQLLALLAEALCLALATGVTMTLCIAAYGRLREVRVELDVEASVEVFR